MNESWLDDDGDSWVDTCVCVPKKSSFYNYTQNKFEIQLEYHQLQSMWYVNNKRSKVTKATDITFNTLIQ